MLASHPGVFEADGHVLDALMHGYPHTDMSPAKIMSRDDFTILQRQAHDGIVTAQAQIILRYDERKVGGKSKEAYGPYS